MATIKLYLDTRKELKHGGYPLKLMIQNKGKILISLNISLTLDQLIENKQFAAGYEVVNHPTRKFYNSYIDKRFIEVKSILLSLEGDGRINTMSPSEIKKIIEGKSQENDKIVLVKDHFLQFIESRNKPRTKDIYLDTYKKIDKYADLESLKFEDINYKWIKNFELFLSETNSVNTVSIHLRNLRAVFNDAIDEDIIGQNLYPFRKFKIKNEPTKKRSLSVDQLHEFMHLECESFQKRYIDLFMLTFYLIGINLVDLLHLKSIDNGYIEYTRSKTNKAYSIKVEPEALVIISKYKGNDYLLNIMDNYKDYKAFTSKINSELKKIGNVYIDKNGNKLIKPLFPYLTTYYARHSWATIAASLDIPKETIAAALGHGGNTITDIYINFDQKKIDEANRKVIDYLNSYKAKEPNK